MNEDFIEVGQRAALISGEGPLVDTIGKTVETIGFKCHVAESSSQAIERMTFTSYDLIVVIDDVDGATPGSNAVLGHLSQMPMAQRRHAYTVLVGDSVRTLDALHAYAQSVHLVVNPGDLGSMGPILKKGLADFGRLYTTYHSILQELSAPMERSVG